MASEKILAMIEEVKALTVLELNELVKEAMDDIVVLDEISRSALNSDYNFTDVTTKRHRYQAVYDLVFY